MSKILELREKRAKAWETAKAFLDAKRGADGLLAVEDVATYRGDVRHHRQDPFQQCGL